MSLTQFVRLLLAWNILLASMGVAEVPALEDILKRAMRVQITKDVEYCEVDKRKLTLDVYEPMGDSALRPGLLLVHGGGWGGRDKSHPNFIEMANEFARRGLVVFNVNYRLSDTDPAPAAVQDVHCAARYIHANARKHRVDPERIAATGNSAGCHLALMVGMCDTPVCQGDASWSQASHSLRAIVNRFAITDAYERAFEQKRKSAVRWFTGVNGDAEALAKEMSPVNYVQRESLPPILTIHGEQDLNTPVEQGIRLHEGLKAHGHDSELFIVPGGNHGLHNLSAEQVDEVERRTFAFLLKHGIFGVNQG